MPARTGFMSLARRGGSVAGEIADWMHPLSLVVALGLGFLCQRLWLPARHPSHPSKLAGPGHCHACPWPVALDFAQRSGVAAPRRRIRRSAACN